MGFTQAVDIMHLILLTLCEASVAEFYSNPQNSSDRIQYDPYVDGVSFFTESAKAAMIIRRIFVETCARFNVDSICTLESMSSMLEYVDWALNDDRFPKLTHPGVPRVQVPQGLATLPRW